MERTTGRLDFFWGGGGEGFDYEPIQQTFRREGIGKLGSM